MNCSKNIYNQSSLILKYNFSISEALMTFSEVGACLDCVGWFKLVDSVRLSSDD